MSDEPAPAEFVPGESTGTGWDHVVTGAGTLVTVAVGVAGLVLLSTWVGAAGETTLLALVAGTSLVALSAALLAARWDLPPFDRLRR